MKTTHVHSVDDYLAKLPKRTQIALQRLRTVIKSAAPKAEEAISYRMPMFKQNGLLVSFAAFASHCSFFVMSPAVIEAHRDELKSFETSKGGIRFTTDKPLPVLIVRMLVKARIAEDESRQMFRSRNSRPYRKANR